MELIKQFLALEARTINWVSADGSMSGIEDYAKDWKETYERGGSRREIAARWGISEQEATRRMMVLTTKFEMKLPNFASQRGVRAPRSPGDLPGRSGSWTQQIVDPEEIVRVINKNGGNISKASVELGMTYSELYKLKRKIEVERPDLKIGRISRAGRPRADADPDDPIPASHQIMGVSKLNPSNPKFREKFARIWNKGNTKQDVYDMFKQLSELDGEFPLLKPQRIDWLAWKIGRFDPDLLKKFPDMRVERWKLKRAEEQQKQAAGLTPEDEKDIEELFKQEPEPAVDDSPEDIFGLDEPAVEDLGVSDAEIDDLFGLKDSEAKEPAEKVEVDPAFDVDLADFFEPSEKKEEEFDPNKEFIDIWNSAASSEEAKKKLRRAGWSRLAIDAKIPQVKSKLKKF